MLIRFLLLIIFNCFMLLSADESDPSKKENEPKSVGGKAEPTPSDKPNKFQLEQINRKYGMFICFGINTFHNEEWTDGSKPASSYSPKTIDANQWVSVARGAGMKYVILVSKHHDGFCLWDSALTEYDVASSPMKTNVVAALSAECKKQGIGFGLYYSLWDRKQNPNTKEPKDDAAYNKYVLGQLQELLTVAGKNGPVVELWLDGSWEKPAGRWPLQEIYALAKKMQPSCQISTNWTIGFPDNLESMCHPNQQKEGFPIRYFPSDFRLGDPDLPSNPDPKVFTHDGKKYYMPWESTVCLSEKWYFNTGDHNYKAPDILDNLYRQATAQENILIINCPPNRDGRMREDDAKILFDMGKRLGLTAK